MPKRLPPLCMEDRDRHGNPRVYLRRKGQPKIRLAGIPWTPMFMTLYEAALKRTAEPAAPARDQPPPGPEPVLPGTLRALCVAYYKSAEFKALDERTRHVRRLILDPVCQKVGNLLHAKLEARNIRQWRDARADRPEAANSLVKALRQVFSSAIENDLADRNPARDVPYLKSKGGGFHSWSLEEVERFEETFPLGTRARLALALLLYTGQRRSDIVLFGRQHVRNGWLRFTQQKNKRNKPISLELPIVPELQAVIDASPCGDLTFLVNEFGRPFTAAGFGNRMRKWCDEAGLPECSAHGLRKAAATRLAEMGRSEHEIMAVTGHQTSKEVGRYTKAARQKVLAGRALGVEMGPEKGRSWANKKGGIGAPLLGHLAPAVGQFG